jgi:hypothetical protein
MSKTTYVLGISALSLLLNPAVYAADGDASASSTTRATVVAELAAARKSGDIPWGDQGLTLRERFPSEFAQAMAAQGKTREQVADELAAARTTGNVISGDEGLTLRERFPSEYASTAGNAPSQATAQGKTREQVADELAAAKSTGDIVWGDQGLTLRERFPSEYRTQVASNYASIGARGVH